MTDTTAPALGSRAVLRRIEPGHTERCDHCGEHIKFRARHKQNRVICNVYVGDRWDRVEHYHDHCYQNAGEPHGSV